MTAVMRAMSVATGPKVLRIGLVQGGRVIEERIVKQRTTVTVGSNEKAMFVIPSQAVPPMFKLFELVGNDYHLNFLDGMTGRVALATGITDIGTLRGQAKKIGNAYQVKLTDEARGKVVVGETTFLFQFVAPPPVQPRPQLPLAVKGGIAAQIDWSLTIIAAFSFLLHFGIVGAMYSDWMDPVVGDDFNVAGLVDMMKNIPVPPVQETPEVNPNATAQPDTKSNAPTAKPAGGGAGGAKAQGGGRSAGSVSDAKAAALAAQAEAAQVAMLAALNGGSSVQGALNRSDIPPVDLSGAAASNAGVARGSSDLKTGGGGAPVQGGGKGSGLAGIGGGTGGSGTGSGAGQETKVAGPTGVAQVGGSTATVPVSDADRVIAGLRARFRSCYQQGLNSDPSMSGKVIISAKVGPNGEVSSADVSQNTGLSPTVASCIANVVKRATFSAPGGGGSTLQIPVTFVQQGK
ncbi:putative abductin-like protein [Labilithrix luteola]|uniref:Putative abductin-like protein n=2 Tax=Labilithrix luteola TaxID=1391654 RepID=A0A0K1Q7V9_9BACT|nr:putative abductin-like protein [Labilithrix luteola]